MVGGKPEDKLNLNLEEVLTKRENNNSLQLADNVVREFKVGIGTPLNGQAKNKIVVNTTEQATKRENKSLPTMEIETHNRDGSKHSQRVYANGWTPLVIGSVPGIAPREQTTFMARMLDFSTSTSRSTSLTFSSSSSTSFFPINTNPP